MSDNIDSSNLDVNQWTAESGDDALSDGHMAAAQPATDEAGSGDILADGALTLDGQDLSGMDDGTVYNLTFTTSGPSELSDNFSVIWNGESVDVNQTEISDPVNGSMQQYNVTLTGGSGDGSDQIEFSGVDENSGVTIENASVVPVADTGNSADDGSDTVQGGDGDGVVYGDGHDGVAGGQSTAANEQDNAGTDGSGGESGGEDGTTSDDGEAHVADDSGENGSGGGSVLDTQSDGADNGAGSGGPDDNANSDAGSGGAASGQDVEGGTSDPNTTDTTVASNDTPDAGGANDDGGSNDDGSSDDGAPHMADGAGEDGSGGGSVHYTSGGGSGSDSGGSGSDGSGSDDMGGSGGGSGDDGDACDLTEGTGPNGDTILGGNGADTINGMSGQDYLSGGNGDDTIFGGTGDDHILGGAGNDMLDGGDGNDCIEGGTGNDTITTGAGADQVDGGDDRDTIFANGGDTVDGGSGGDDYDTLVVQNVDHIEYTSSDNEDGIVHFNDGQTLEFEDIEEIVPCFTPGSIILTSVGEKRVEDLQLGDKIVTRDNGVQEIRWIGTKRVDGRRLLENPHLRPVLIRKGALGKGLPERDMTVSPNHRMLVANEKTTLLFEEREVLVAAKHLINMNGIQQITSVGISYIHMMFDEHEVILGDGAWTESFQPGDYSLKGVGTAQRNEIFELFPELRESHGRKKYVAARRSLKRKEARLLH